MARNVVTMTAISSFSTDTGLSLPGSSEIGWGCWTDFGGFGFKPRAAAEIAA
jgi:hypothetical protein